jgi:hypothetical protein
MIAANSVSSGVSFVPPPCGRTFDGGISGSAISHRPSGTIQLHVPRPMHSPTSDHHIGHSLTSWCVIVGEACFSCSRPFSGCGGAVGDEPGDGAVGVGQAVAAVGPARQLLPAFVVGEGVFDGDAVG